MHPIKKNRLTVILALAIIFVAPLLAFAEGDGSGGGQNQPLALLTSTPADGARNVARDTEIKLSFNKNVVNMSVQANNRKCFTITQGQNNVAFNVVMADDQVQPEGKRDIILVPKSSLLPGTSYKVTISSGLQAKNGSAPTQAVSITFTTAGAAPQEQPAQNLESKPTAVEPTPPRTDAKETAPKAAEPQSDASSSTTSLSPAVDAAQEDASQARSESVIKENHEASRTPVKGLAYAGIIVLLGAGGLLFYRGKRK